MKYFSWSAQPSSTCHLPNMHAHCQKKRVRYSRASVCTGVLIVSLFKDPSQCTDSSLAPVFITVQVEIMSPLLPSWQTWKREHFPMGKCAPAARLCMSFTFTVPPCFRKHLCYVTIPDLILMCYSSIM